MQVPGLEGVNVLRYGVPKKGEFYANSCHNKGSQPTSRGARLPVTKVLDDTQASGLYAFIVEPAPGYTLKPLPEEYGGDRYVVEKMFDAPRVKHLVFTAHCQDDQDHFDRSINFLKQRGYDIQILTD